MKTLLLVPLMMAAITANAQRNQVSIAAGGSMNTKPSHFDPLYMKTSISPSFGLKYSYSPGKGVRFGAELDITKWQNKASLVFTNVNGNSTEVKNFRYIFANPALSAGIFVSKEFDWKSLQFVLAPSAGYVSLINKNGLTLDGEIPKSNQLGEGEGFYAGLKAGCLYKVSKRFSVGPEVNIRYATASVKVEHVNERVNYNLFYFPVRAQVAYSF